MTEQKRCVIFAAGPMEAPERLPELWTSRPDDLVIAADGGFRNAALLGIKPDIVMGDMDSLAKEEAPADTRIFPVRKDDTDTMLAIRTGIGEGCREFLIFGALGGRLDHTYANIQSLAFLLDNGCRGTLLDGKHLCTMIRNESITLESSFRHLSVFSYSDKSCGVSESGVGYTLTDGELTNSFPLGVSNNPLSGEKAILSVREGTLLIILSDHT